MAVTAVVPLVVVSPIPGVPLSMWDSTIGSSVVADSPRITSIVLDALSRTSIQDPLRIKPGAISDPRPNRLTFQAALKIRRATPASHDGPAPRRHRYGGSCTSPCRRSEPPRGSQHLGRRLPALHARPG